MQPKQLGLFQAAIPDYELAPTRNLNNAFVSRQRPNVVVYDPEVTKEAPYVFSHEFEHQLAAKGLNAIAEDYRKGGKTYNQLDINLMSAVNPTAYNFYKILSDQGADNNAVKQMEKGLESVIVKRRLKEILPMDTKSDIARIGRKNQPFFEYLADLSGLETEYGVDLTQDPVIRKEVFGDDPVKIQAYKAVTGLRQTRLDAKDIAPYTYVPPEPPKPKSITERFMDLFSNPLMEDTTK
jgi:hypothetical protein